MLSYIYGRLEEKSDGIAVIDVNGVGYEVMVTNSCYCALPSLGEMVKIYVYMRVSEDDISLFGFDSLREKNLFLKLLSVSGVGSKTAIQILSGIKLQDLINSNSREDSRYIANIKGIGKKTAERIILELKDKINPFEYVLPIEMKHNIDETKISSVIEDAVLVLVSLGVSKSQATKLCKEVYSTGDSADVIVQNALKNMGNI